MSTAHSHILPTLQNVGSVSLIGRTYTWQLLHWNSSHPSFPHNPAMVGPLQSYPSQQWPVNLTCLISEVKNTSLQLDNLPHCTHYIMHTKDRAVCSPKGWFIGCKKGAYTCLPTRWTGSCTLVLLVPALTINSQDTIEMSLLSKSPDIHLNHKIRTIHAPILIGASISAVLGIGLGAGGIGMGIHAQQLYHQLSLELHRRTDDITPAIRSLQNQVNSLAAVTLQNQRALDVLMAERGSTCAMLGAECCYFINETGIVTDKIKNLCTWLEHKYPELGNYLSPTSPWSWWNDTFGSWAPFLLPLLGPIIMIMACLPVGPCIFKLLSSFVQFRLREIAAKELVAQADIPNTGGHVGNTCRPLAPYHGGAPIEQEAV
ncbi:PREDICTED: syncytin-1-like isoform X1 [Chinchilla lanigera]|uniref:syncytin-1-like isoform X1 n=1 Tax=Chinchilla lanigera TaxID=34839 RepID=UPI00038ECDD1|nr:PREDICTED: syncytin-1-like isoform X1 [Chinchilla lanigera]